MEYKCGCLVCNFLKPKLSIACSRERDAKKVHVSFCRMRVTLYMRYDICRQTIYFKDLILKILNICFENTWKYKKIFMNCFFPQERPTGKRNQPLRKLCAAVGHHSSPLYTYILTLGCCLPLVHAH